MKRTTIWLSEATGEATGKVGKEDRHQASRTDPPIHRQRTKGRELGVSSLTRPPKLVDFHVLCVSAYTGVIRVSYRKVQ